MPTYRVRVAIKDFTTIKYPDGKGPGDCVRGLPRDAEAEVCATPPYLGCARMVDYTVELDGPAQHVRRS